jgi:hypothetical protein
MGLYIVKPKLRGRGIGRKLEQFALDACKDCNLGLDGVESMHRRYEQVGLRLAYGNTRYSGTAKAERNGGSLRIKPKDLAEIKAYDKQVFMWDRTRFLNCWLFQNDAASLMSKNAEDQVVGYGVIRRCMQGHKIGPLFADDAATAELLFDDLATAVCGETIYLDTPQPNELAAALARKKQMQPVFSTVRMYSKAEPKAPLGKIFGVTTFELG